MADPGPSTLLVELARGQGEVAATLREVVARLDRRDRHDEADNAAVALVQREHSTRIDALEKRWDRAAGAAIGIALGAGVTGGGVAAVVAQVLGG